MSKSPEWKRLLGYRQQNNDGFEYEYGYGKGGYGPGKLRRQRKNIIPRCKRNDKRSVRQKEEKFSLENDYEY